MRKFVAGSMVLAVILSLGAIGAAPSALADDVEKPSEVKIFTGILSSDEKIAAFERSIGDWLRVTAGKIVIKDIRQSSVGPISVSVVVLYEKRVGTELYGAKLFMGGPFTDHLQDKVNEWMKASSGANGVLTPVRISQSVNYYNAMTLIVWYRFGIKRQP